MSERLFVRDQVELDTTKIETDTDPVHGPVTIFKDVVIASEIIHEYEDGWAYKPADELENAYWTWNDRWATAGDHPETGIIMNVDSIHGKTTNVRFVKNLKDHKTGRPQRRGILADLVVFDRKVSPELLTDMKSGNKRNVSIGFFFTKDDVAGIIEEDGHPLNGTKYDYIQRAFMGDHTAFGLEMGRCSFPNCGIGADQLITAGDPFAGYETFSECIADIMKQNPSYTREQAAGTCAEIEKRSKAKHKKDEEDDETLKSDAEVKLNMEKVSDLKSKLNEILSELDDLVEEEYQGNAELETETERAMKYFNISEDDWLALSDEDKEDYISRLPPKKKRAGGEEMSEKDCTYEWVTIREKILSLNKIEPMTLSKIIGDMKFEEDLVTITRNAMNQLAEMGVELDDCECDEEKLGEDELDIWIDAWILENIGEDVTLSSAQKRALPDSAYAYIEKGCKKVDGKTEQKCRHFIIHDVAHVRAALAALKGARTGKTPAFAKQAKPKICSAAKKFKIESEVCGTKGGDVSPEELMKKFDRTLIEKDLYEP